MPTLLVLQTLAVLPGLFGDPLWLDEAYSALMARQPIAQIHQRLAYDAGPPLYYDLLHYWRAGFGETEAVLRGLSMLCALAVTIVIYFTGKRFLNPSAAKLSALLWAFSPLSVYYAHEARNYTLLALLMMGGTWCFLRFLLESQRVFLDFAVVFMILLIYIHNLAWFAWLGMLSTALLLRPQAMTLRVMAIAFGVVLLAYFPWLPTLYQQWQNAALTIGWVKQFWQPQAIGVTLTTFLPGGGNPGYLGLPTLPVFLQWFNLGLWSVPLIAALRHYVQRRALALGGLIGTMLFTLMLPYLFSLTFTPIYLPGRTDFIVFPLFCLWLGYGIQRFPWRPVQYGFVFMYLLASGTVLPQQYAHNKPVGEHEIARYLKNHAKKSDIVLCTGLTRPGVEYYLQDHPVTIASFPNEMARHLAHFPQAYYQEKYSPQQLRDEILNWIGRLAPGQRLWIAKTPEPLNNAIDKALQSAQNQQNAGQLNNGSYTIRVSPPIQTPRMGIRKLNVPVSILRAQKVLQEE